MKKGKTDRRTLISRILSQDTSLIPNMEAITFRVMGKNMSFMLI